MKVRTRFLIIMTLCLSLSTHVLYEVCAQELAYLDAKGVSAQPSDSQKMQQKISLDFKNIEITDALKFLAKKTGLNIVPTKQVTGRVSLTVENADVEDILHVMLRSHGLAYDRRGSIYNVMTESEYKLLYGKKFSDVSQIKVFHLRYAIPQQVFNLLNTVKSEIGKVLLDAESGNILVSDTPKKIEEMAHIVRSLEKKTTNMKVFDLKYASAKEMAKQLKNHLDVKKIGSVKADERSNQVIVETLPERMPEVEKLIKGLDRKTREVLIDVRIVNITLSNDITKGIEWEGLFDMGMQTGLAYLGSTPFSAVQKATDDFRTRLEVFNDAGVGSYPFSGTTSDVSSSVKRTGLENLHLGMVTENTDFDVLFKYLRTIGDTKVVANPKIAVIENHEAKIHIGEKQAYITNTTTQTSSTTTVAEEVTFVDVGIQLFITPTINKEGFITLTVKPEISSVVSFLETGENNKIPIINTSTTETTVMIKDGATVLLGGLKQESETETREETPFMSRIPLVGGLFKAGTKENEHKEFLVMITPHIIGGDELVTGARGDFDNAYKDNKVYPSVAGGAIDLNHKTYRDYNIIEVPQNIRPEIKPARNF